MKNKENDSVPILIQIYGLIWMKSSILPQTVGLLKLMANFASDNLYVQPDFIECTFNIGLLCYTCESICFKLGSMLDTTKLSNTFPVSMTLTFSQESSNLCNHSVVKMHEATQIFLNGRLCKSGGFRNVL